MKFTIVGAGAIGGVIGAYLIKAGEDVTFVDKAVDHVSAINKKGLTITLKNENFTVPAQAYTVAKWLSSDKDTDVVLLCVKAQHTKKAIKQIKSKISYDSIVVSFQNGLCEEVIAEEIGVSRTIGCFVNLYSDYIEPGLINYGGVGSVYIGEVDGEITPRVKAIVERISACGDVRATNNINGYLWSKLAYGAILTATALTNETIADIIGNRQNREMLLDLASEVLEIASKKNIQTMEFDDWNPTQVYPPSERNWDDINSQLDHLVIRLRSYTKTRSGIWRDLAVRKRETEVPTHFSSIIKEGESHSVEMPLLKAVLNMIVGIEKGKREISTDNLNELHALHQLTIQNGTKTPN